MTAEARRYRGVRTDLNDDDLWRMYSEHGMSGSEIARRTGRTPQAINFRLKRLRENRVETNGYLLPWAVKAAHATGYVHRAVIAYAHRQRGEALTLRQRTELEQMEMFLREHDAVITYDYNQGYAIRNRRPEDGHRLVV